MNLRGKINSVILALMLCLSAVQMPSIFENEVSLTAMAANVTLSDMPSKYQYIDTGDIE